jgi:hypothetical protein
MNHAKPTPPAVDISSEAVAERIDCLRDGTADRRGTSDMLEALAADRDRLGMERDEAAEQIHLLRAVVSADAQLLAIAARAEKAESDRDRHRTFVRSARRIVREYARQHATDVSDGRPIDPMGAYAWLESEEAEIGIARDGDPKVEGGRT